MDEIKSTPMIMDDVLSTNISVPVETSNQTTNTAVGTPMTNQGFVLPPKTKTIIRAYTKKVGRNDPCPCGSGKKYKKCCLESGKYEERYELSGLEMRQVKDHEKKPEDFKQVI